MTTKILATALAVALFFCVSISAQTTAFTYQGSLKDGASSANGNYDFEFKLFDLASGGVQQGSTIQRLNVAVANGVFTVPLDFGAAVLPGADRFLEIGLRVNGNPGGFQQLLPRQPVASSPYSVRSLAADNATNATQLGGIAANQFVVTTDPRMTDARQPTAGSSSYIQNGTSPQASSNFSISGTGTANVLNATTQFNIGGTRILSSSSGTFNLFAGSQTGQAITTGIQNSFFGGGAGQSTTTGSNNSFFGTSAGVNNTTGGNNAFFGSGAGVANTTASANSFFGTSAGQSNSTGTDNAFFGAFAGQSNTTGSRNAFFGAGAGAATADGFQNSFFGESSGSANTSGAHNSFFGFNAGAYNTTGGGNSFFGEYAGVNNTTGIANAFFGGGAGFSNTSGGSNALFGRSAGASNTTGASNAFFGTDAGDSNTTGIDNSFFGRYAGDANTIGVKNTAIGYHADFSADNLSFATAIGADSVASLSNSIYLGRPGGEDAVRIPGATIIDGSLVIGTLGSAGATSICLNGANRVSPCSSSLRYKTNIGQFSSGMAFVNRLRPITFDWKDGGMKDVGFGAEDIAKIDPRFVTYNEKGEVEGVKYDRLSVPFVNAFKEQQTQIAEQQKQIDELKMIVCSLKPEAAVCNRTGK